MALNDVYRLVDRQTFIGVNCVNVWFFQHQNGSGDATDLWRAFRDSRLPTVASIQHNGVDHIGLSVDNLNDLTDFNESDFGAPIPGDRLGSPQPSFNSWTFKMTRQTKQMQNGRKAFVGVTEEDTANNGPNPAMEAILNNVASLLDEAITGPAGGIFKPVLYRAPGAIAPGSPEQIVQIISASFRNLSTQNTRKAF